MELLHGALEALILRTLSDGEKIPDAACPPAKAD